MKCKDRGQSLEDGRQINFRIQPHKGPYFSNLLKRPLKICPLSLVALVVAVCLTANAALAEDPAPYRGMNFEWEYGDYAACAGFNIYKAGESAPLAVLSDRTARKHYQLMPMAVGQSMCFTMDVFDAKGQRSEMSPQKCVIVPLPGVEMFMAFPGAGK